MDEVGKYTLEIMRDASWYNNWLFSIIEPHLKREILEVGAGIGNITGLLIDKYGKVHAIDINKIYVNKLKSKFKDKLDIVLGKIEKPDHTLKENSFNTVICLNVLEHIKEERAALKNMFKLLKKDGKLILLVPAHEFLYSHFDSKLGHFRRYNKKQLDLLLTNTGFKKISMKYLNLPSALGWFIFLKLTKKSALPENNVKIFNNLGRIFLWPEKYIEPPFGLSILAVYEK